MKMRAAIALLAVALLAAVSFSLLTCSFQPRQGIVSDQDSSDWITISQSGEFEVSIPAGWNINLGLPAWAYLQDPPNNWPVFGAGRPIEDGPQGPAAGDPAVVVVTMRSEQPSLDLNLMQVVERLRRDMARSGYSAFGQVLGETDGNLRFATFSASGDRPRGGHSRQVTTAIAEGPVQVAKIRVISCSSSTDTMEAIHALCSQVARSFKVIPDLPPSPRPTP